MASESPELFSLLFAVKILKTIHTHFGFLNGVNEKAVVLDYVEWLGANQMAIPGLAERDLPSSGRRSS